MSNAFAKEEMIQAKEFRSLSQKALQQEIRTHEKIGVLFQNTGLGKACPPLKCITSGRKGMLASETLQPP